MVPILDEMKQVRVRAAIDSQKANEALGTRFPRENRAPVGRPRCIVILRVNKAGGFETGLLFGSETTVGNREGHMRILRGAALDTCRNIDALSMVDETTCESSLLMKVVDSLSFQAARRCS